MRIGALIAASGRIHPPVKRALSRFAARREPQGLSAVLHGLVVAVGGAVADVKQHRGAASGFADR
jgi:hypothetical protein